MKKICFLICFIFLCGLLQGCSSKQTAQLDDNIEVSLETIAINDDFIKNDKFIIDNGDINFLLKVTNNSNKIYEIDSEKLLDKIIPINQDGEIKGDTTIDVTDVNEIEPKKTKDIIIRTSIGSNSEEYDAIGLMVNDEQLLTGTSDNKIQTFDLGKVKIERTSIEYNDDNLSVKLELHNLKDEDNITFYGNKTLSGFPNLEFDYTIKNKTNRTLISPEILMVQSNSYTTNHNYSNSNLLNPDTFNYELGVAKEKEALLSDNNIIQYLKDGNDLSLEEIRNYESILADSGIYLDETHSELLPLETVAAGKTKEEKNQLAPVDGVVIRMEAKFTK